MCAWECERHTAVSENAFVGPARGLSRKSLPSMRTQEAVNTSPTARHPQSIALQNVLSYMCTSRAPHSPAEHDGREQSGPVHPSGQLHRSGPSHTPPFSHTKEHTADTARIAWFPASATYKNRCGETMRWTAGGGRGGGSYTCRQYMMNQGESILSLTSFPVKHDDIEADERGLSVGNQSCAGRLRRTAIIAAQRSKKKNTLLLGADLPDP